MFKEKLDELSDIALDISGTKHDYTDEDLSNAMLVFVEVLFNKMYDKHYDKIKFSEMLTLAENIRKTLHSLTLEWTDVNLHKIYPPRQ
jgi:DNA-binding MurR/RpiR family transcriptional regulator